MNLEFKQGVKVVVIHLEVISTYTLGWYLKPLEILIVMRKEQLLSLARGTELRPVGGTIKIAIVIIVIMATIIYAIYICWIIIPKNHP